MVPCQPLSDLMRRWAKERNLDRENPMDFKNNRSWEKTLCKKTGIHRRKLYAILSGEQKHIQFNTADKLLCAMDMNHMWHQEPLSKYYGPIEVSRHERNRKDMIERFREGARWRVRVVGKRIYEYEVEVLNLVTNRRVVVCRDVHTGAIRRYSLQAMVALSRFTYLGYGDELAAVA